VACGHGPSLGGSTDAYSARLLVLHRLSESKSASPGLDSSSHPLPHGVAFLGCLELLQTCLHRLHLPTMRSGMWAVCPPTRPSRGLLHSALPLPTLVTPYTSHHAVHKLLHHRTVDSNGAIVLLNSAEWRREAGLFHSAIPMEALQQKSSRSSPHEDDAER